MPAQKDFFPELDSVLREEMRQALKMAVSNVECSEMPAKATVGFTFTVSKDKKSKLLLVDIDFSEGKKVKRRAVVVDGQLRLELIDDQ